MSVYECAAGTTTVSCSTTFPPPQTLQPNLSITVTKYFLLGNPVVYWASTAALPTFGLIFAWYLLRWQRGYRELNQWEMDQIHYSGIYPVVGWFLHYFPFLAMARVTYVHHYYPALYFAVLTLGFCVDWLSRPLQKNVQWGLYVGWYAAVAYMYWLFRPICFGMTGPHTGYAHLKWFDRWRITGE